MSERLTDEQLSDLRDSNSEQWLVPEGTSGAVRRMADELIQRRASDSNRLELDDYEASNLFWLLHVARRLDLDTGDWLRQIIYKLRQRGLDKPKADPIDVEHRIANHRASAERVGLSSEQREAIELLVAEIRDEGERLADYGHHGVALDVLNRLLSEGGK